MVTPATLSVPTTNNNNSISIKNNKRQTEKNIISALTRISTEAMQQSTNDTNNNLVRKMPTFRIPKIARPVPDPPVQQPSPTQPMDTNSSSIPTIKLNLSPDHQSTDETNIQQGKRKVSLTQYKENKRLKSNDSTQNYSADIDMRMDLKNSPPTIINDDSAIPSTNNQLTIADRRKNLVLKSNLSEPGIKKLIKKKVIWADEKEQALVETSFFEIDDSEKTDIHAFARQCEANISLAKLEKLMERQFCKQQALDNNIKSFDNNDDKTNLPALPNLIPILLPDTIPKRVVKSQECFLQEERERTVLQALLTPLFLPDNPGEADGDFLRNNTIEPKLIPLDNNAVSSPSNEESSINDNADNEMSVDVSLPSTTTTTTTPTIPLTSTVTPSRSSLPLENVSAEVAQILAQAKGNLTAAITNNSSSTSANTPINPPISLPTTTSNPNLSSLANLHITPEMLSALLNVTRANPNIPSANPLPTLPVNFNIPSPSQLAMNQLLLSALALTLPAAPTLNNPLFQTPPPAPVRSTMNFHNNSSSTNAPSVRFSSPLGRQSPRFNQMNNSRGVNRGRVYRRGLHTNNNNRGGFHRNQNQNQNNRNIFS